MLDQFVCHDADEARGESALRGKYLLRALGKFAHGRGNGHIFGQIEVMQSLAAGDFGNRNVAMVRKARHDRGRLMLLNVVGQCFFVAGVEIECDYVLVVMRTDYSSGYAGLGVGKLHSIAA